MTADQLFSDLPVASERAGAGSLDPSTTSTERRNDLVTGSTDVAAGGERARLEGEAGRASSLPAVAPLVIGLDLSITRTGVAGADWTSTIRTEKRAGGIDDDLRRISKVRTDVLDIVRVRGAELVVVEGPSYASQGQGHHTLAGLWWAVVGGLREWGYAVAIATPSALKKYASGKGNTAKEGVLVAVTRRFTWFAGTADEADALVLCAMGRDHLGHALVDMPAVHREALAKVAWPGDQR